MRDSVACCNFIPGGASGRGGGQALAFSVARFQTPSGVYISHTLIWDSQVIHHGSSAVGPYRVLMGFRWDPDCFGTTGPIKERVARPSCIDAQLMFGPLGTPRRPHVPSGSPSGPNGPPADRRRHRLNPFPRSLPGLGGPQLPLASAMAIVSKRSDRRRNSYS